MVQVLVLEKAVGFAPVKLIMPPVGVVNTPLRHKLSRFRLILGEVSLDRKA
jgi:hypothetical protein